MDTKPSSKTRYILPTVLGTVSLITSIGIIMSLFSRQINHYIGNAAVMTSKWMQEGMKEEALGRSIQFFAKIKLLLSIELTGKVITFLIQIGVAMATENWVVNGKNANNIVEIIAILYHDAYPAAMHYLYLISKDTACAVFVILSLAVFYFFTRNKISWKEQLLYAAYLLIIIHTIAVLFISDYKFGISPDKNIPIEKYSSMDADLKNRIIKAASSNGIAKESIFIVNTKEVNASATRGLRFKYIFITTALLDLLNSDQLLAIVHHEIGHVINNHVIKGAIVGLVYSSCMFVLVVFGYRKLSACYNGLMAWVLLDAAYLLSCQIYMHYYMIHVSHKHEYEADYNAYAREGYSKSLVEAGKACSLLDGYGALFDYEDWIALFRTHPSWYKRISATRDYYYKSK